MAFTLGLVTGFVIATCGTAVWISTPRLRHWLRYESIGGTYSVHDATDPDAQQVGSASIRQRGSRVWVHFERQISRGGRYLDRPTVFSCHGRYRAGILAVTVSDFSSYRPGAIVMHYNHNDGILSGKASYFKLNGGVISVDLELRRNDSPRSDL